LFGASWKKFEVWDLAAALIHQKNSILEMGKGEMPVGFVPKSPKVIT
jgi:hypothetical protein